MNTLHLFAGAGGSALADLIRGRKPVAFCEIDKDCRAVLGKRFPDAPCFPDVAALTGDMVRNAVGEIDVISGGSPCQDVSLAGKGLGFAAGARSSLIWHQLRLVAELRPRLMEWENVPGAIAQKHRPQFDAFLLELGQLGYGGAWCVLSASQVGAPHQRKRVWLLAERDRPGGFREVPTKHMPAWPAKADTAVALWATPRVSGSGTEDFVRDDGKLRDDLQTMAIMAECVTTAPSAWPTPTVQDGENAAGPSQFARNTLPLNAEVFRELVRNMPPDQVKAIIGDRRLNPAWVENLMGWPIGWTDLSVSSPRIPTAAGGAYEFPAGRWAEQKPHEPPRITSVKARSGEAKARNAALKQLGNGWVPQQASRAFAFLEKNRP